MYDAKDLEKFFSHYMPAMKMVIENMWSDRKELQEHLEFCISQNAYDNWVLPYFKDMLHYVKVAPHKYTSPWDVL